MKHIIVLVFALLILIAPQAYAVAPIIDLVEQKKTYNQILTKEEVLFIVQDKARKYNINPDTVMSVIDCEVRGEYNPSIQSRMIINGEREDSYGLAQINLYWNPDITYEQAIDPEFSIDFLARRISEGYGKRWTCYRLKYS